MRVDELMRDMIARTVTLSKALASYRVQPTDGRADDLADAMWGLDLFWENELKPAIEHTVPKPNLQDGIGREVARRG